jgi:hypothetical protein
MTQTEAVRASQRPVNPVQRPRLVGRVIGDLGRVLVFAALAAGTVAGVAAVVNTFPVYLSSALSAPHQSMVPGSLLVLSALWLLSGLVCWVRDGGGLAGREPATFAGETEGSGLMNVTAVTHYEGRGPSHRPRANREVAG